MDRNDITILVNSCDAYEDIWDPFFRLFRVYWGDCPYEIVLNTESKKYELEGINIQCLQLYSENRKVPYGKRILEHLKYVKTKYVLILIDDFFLNDYVDNNEIEKCRTWMEDNQNIAAFFFAPVKDQGNIVSEKYKGYEKRPKVGVYKVSFQAALWRTTDFIESWKKHENPWEWEKQATFRSFFNNKEYFTSTISKLLSKKYKREERNFPLRQKMGIGIDIWSLGGFPNDISDQKVFSDNMEKIGNEWKEKVVIPYGTSLFCKKDYEQLVKKIKETILKYDLADSRWVSCIYCGTFGFNHGRSRVMLKEDYINRHLTKFETEEFWIPDGYDKILKADYGDYMILPLEEKRESKKMRVYQLG